MRLICLRCKSNKQLPKFTVPYKNCGKSAVFWKHSLNAGNLSVVVGKFPENEGQSLLRSKSNNSSMCNANTIVLEREEKVADKVAEAEIRKFLTALKGSGGKKVGIIDLLAKFSYPSQQIERVMEKLEKEGVVKEDWPPW